MMRLSKPAVFATALASAIVLCSGLHGDAFAESFDGFTKVGDYVVSGKKVCKPVRASAGIPSCTKLTAKTLAALTVKKPSAQMRRTARFEVSARGDSLAVHIAGDSKAQLTWSSGSPIGRVLATFVSKDGTVVVAEYETRFGGRTAQMVVGFAVSPGTSRQAPTSPTTKTTTPTTKTIGPKLSAADQKRFDRLLVVGWKQLSKKRYKKAIGAADKALAVWDQSAEALSILAAAKARLKDSVGALTALERLATSTDSLAPEYRVDARTADAFEVLRADKRYRLAVGITRDPKRPASAYERVMGLGGRWEQRLISCEQAEVKLRLRRVRKRFTLAIKSKCGGPADVIDLSGRFATRGTDQLELIFPNHEAGDENLMCKIERCKDSPGEDCLQCNLGEDLDFLLHVTRR